MRELRRRDIGVIRLSGSDCAVAVWRWTLIFPLAALVMPAAVQFGYADEPPASQAEALPEARATREEMLEVADRLVRQFPRDPEKAFRKVCELAPEESSGYFSLVQLCLRNGRQLPDVTTLTEKVVQLEPTAPSYFLLSSVYQKNNESDKAQAAIRRALELDPDNPQYRKMQKLVQGRP